MIEFALNVLSHTPIWVWGLLAALLALGLHQAREHRLPRTRVLLQPLALGLLSLWSASAAFGLHWSVQAPWLMGALLGWTLHNAVAAPVAARVLPDGRLLVAGSWSPLRLMMAIFALRYAGSVALAVVPTLSRQPVFLVAASVLYGLPCGWLAGRALRLLAAAAAPRAGALPA